MTKATINQIQFCGINKSFSSKRFARKKQQKLILNDLDITLSGGECTLLTGKNGSGKSTLLRILAGLIKPDRATIHHGLESLGWKKARKLLRKQFMYLYQEPYMFDGSVRRNLLYATAGHLTSQRINQALQWADLEHRADTQAKCLSGGEKQRVALAQAWLKQPLVLLLDEPTANMDDYSRQLTEELLLKFKNNDTALLIASHDPNHFYHVADKTLSLIDGALIDKPIKADRNLPENVAPFPNKLGRQ